MKVSAEKMRAAWQASGKSQQDIADEMGATLNRPVHFTTISRWVNGHMEPETIETIVAFAGACGVGDFRSLLDREVNEEEQVRERFAEALLPIADLLTDLIAEARRAAAAQETTGEEVAS
jgi:transcriptional regulator with XRE-family HTH domain